MSPARSRMICARRWRACCGEWRRRGRAASARRITNGSSTPRSATYTACWKPSTRCCASVRSKPAPGAPGSRNLDLAALAREVAEAFQPAAADEGKTMAIDLAAPLPMRGDRELLTQLIANLIDNAIRHTPTGACIEVASAAAGNLRQLVVADDGAGVPASERSRIFDRFYRVDSARAIPGDGLGLSLVAAIAELHDGQVRAVDNAPGLKIIVEFPVVVASSAANAAPLTPARPPGSPPASSAPGRAPFRSRS